MINKILSIGFFIVFISCDDDCTNSFEIPATTINGQEISPARTIEIPCDEIQPTPAVPIG